MRISCGLFLLAASLALGCSTSTESGCPPSCPTNAACATGESTCTCKSGFTKLTESAGVLACVDVDECANHTANCDANAACLNTPGSYTCTCNHGYSGDGATCTDVDECANGSAACDPNAVCTNTPGSYSCTCGSGYLPTAPQPPPGACTAEDKCSDGTGTCAANSTCTSTGPGTYSCTCATGYLPPAPQLPPGTCTAEDKCANGTATCDAHAACTSTGPGTYSCTCATDYLPLAPQAPPGACTAEDKCTDGTATCDTNATCTSTGPGTYACACNQGFLGNGMSCTPDPCADGTAHCDPNAVCATVPDGFTCTCQPGWNGNGTFCEQASAGGVVFVSGGGGTPTAGTLLVQPPGNDLRNGDLATGDLTGWTLVENNGNGAVVGGGGLFSGDLWRTSYDWDSRGQEIALTDFYTIAALDGANPPALAVLDWALGVLPNVADWYYLHAELRDANHNAIASLDDGTELAWVTLDGSYQPEGLNFSGYPSGARYLYIQDGGHDEEFWAGQYGAAISNTWVGDPGVQMRASNDGATWTAWQAWTPVTAWTLSDTAPQTVSVQFQSATGAALGTVTFTTTICTSGFTVLGNTCVANNACTDGSATCDPNATCTSTGPGTYSCTCNGGYTPVAPQLPPGTCAAEDSCTDGTATCDPNATCTSTGPGTYSCACNPGFTGDGMSCISTDPCVNGTARCDPNAVCTDIPGGFTCTCPAGWIGSGTFCGQPSGGGVVFVSGGGATPTTGSLLVQPPADYLQNGDLATGDLTDWTVVENNGSGAVVGGGGLFSGDLWRTSYDWDSRGQEVPLNNFFTTVELDGASPPALSVLDWALGVLPNVADWYYLYAELRDASHNAIVTQDDGTYDAWLTLDGSFQPMSLTFTGYPAGARYLYVQDGGHDQEFWAGQYGAAMSNAWVGDPGVQMRVSNDGVTWTAWQTWTSTMSWTVSDTAPQTVAVQFQSASGADLGTVSFSTTICPTGFTAMGNTCVANGACTSGSAVCDPNATCNSTDATTYTCSCNSGYTPSTPQSPPGTCTPGSPTPVYASQTVAGVSDYYGDSGGSPFGPDTCPRGEVLIGFGGNNGGNIDELFGICGSVMLTPTADGVVVEVGTGHTVLPAHGENITNAFSAICPTNEVLTRVDGYYDASDQSGSGGPTQGLHQFSIYCSSMSATGGSGPPAITLSAPSLADTVTNDYNLSSSATFSYVCPPPSAIGQISGRAGYWMDGLSFSCFSP